VVIKERYEEKEKIKGDFKNEGRVSQVMDKERIKEERTASNVVSHYLLVTLSV
jgi:hypothetical protein